MNLTACVVVTMNHQCILSCLTLFVLAKETFNFKHFGSFQLPTSVNHKMLYIKQFK